MVKNGTSLHDAASRRDFNLAKEINENTPQLAQATDDRGRLALHLAAARGYVEIVKMLVSNDDLNTCCARDIDGWNPLHLAAMNGEVEVLKVLIEKCPYAAEARAGRGETILHICFKYNHKEAIKLLLENAKIQEELVNAKNDDGNTLLHMVVADQNATVTNNEIVNILLACPNIDTSVTNSHKQTPLDIAIKREQRLKKSKLDKKVAASLVNSLREEDAPTAKELGRINWVEEKRGSLMVVASLIATMAFQAVLTPPGRDINLAAFLVANTTGFVWSLSVILLLISELPFKNKFFMCGLTIIMCGALAATANSYYFAALTHGTDADFWMLIWYCIVGFLVLIHTIRICLRLRKIRDVKFYILKSMKKLGFRKKQNNSGPDNGASAHPV